jgi:hypothetical protein
MNQQMFWHRLTIVDFFSNFNWDGKPQNGLSYELGVPSSEPQVPSLSQRSLNTFDQSAWLELSVQGFFSQSNWLGQPQAFSYQASSNGVRSSSSTAASQFQPIQMTYSATSPVGAFLQFIPWDGQPEIAARPDLEEKLPALSEANQITLTDLSDLF